MSAEVKVFLVTFALCMYPACGVVGFVKSETQAQHDHGGCMVMAILGGTLTSALTAFVIVGMWTVLR